MGVIVFKTNYISLSLNLQGFAYSSKNQLELLTI